jgi:hypothetical protein
VTEALAPKGGTVAARSKDLLELAITFSFEPSSGLFSARLDNGTRFSVAPINVSGKLGANLDLLRQFTMRARADEAPNPHPCASKLDFGASRDAALIEEAIRAGKLQRVGVVNEVPKPGTLTLEDLGL